MPKRIDTKAALESCGCSDHHDQCPVREGGRCNCPRGLTLALAQEIADREAGPARIEALERDIDSYRRALGMSAVDWAALAAEGKVKNT